jgi:hypothetical protein
MKAGSTRWKPASAKSSAPLLQISIPCLFGKRQTEDDTQGYGPQQFAESLGIMANAQREIFVFFSAQNHCLMALTMDVTGARLPMGFGPWQRSLDHNMTGFAHREEITAAIALKGFYLSRSDGVAW